MALGNDRCSAPRAGEAEIVDDQWPVSHRGATLAKRIISPAEVGLLIRAAASKRDRVLLEVAYAGGLLLKWSGVGLAALLAVAVSSVSALTIAGIVRQHARNAPVPDLKVEATPERIARGKARVDGFDGACLTGGVDIGAELPTPVGSLPGDCSTGSIQEDLRAILHDFLLMASGYTVIEAVEGAEGGESRSSRRPNPVKLLLPT
jgi:hypothetical protein